MKCPKCQRDMVEGRRLSARSPMQFMMIYDVKFTRKKTSFDDDEITPYHCSLCGYIELYKAMKKGSP